MKKRLSVAAILIALACVLTISACDGGDSTQTPSGTVESETNEKETAESETNEKETTESETNDHVHAFGEWKVISEPTCTELGSQERICSCGETEIKSIDKLGHAEVIDPAVAPTCTEEGKTEGKHCSRCSAVLVAQKKLPMSHHNWTTAYEYDQEKHWKRCVLCNDTTSNEAHVLESDGWCQICKHPVAATPGVAYELSDDSSYAMVIGYSGNAARVNIAAEYQGVPVTGIYEGAFQNTAITAVVIPDSVTSIGRGAFGGCSSLTAVTIGGSVTSIGWEAFAHCDSLTTVTIPDSVTSIGSGAFYYCTSLTTVTIPDSVTRIGSRAFEDCDSLTGVYITDVAAWCSIDFANYDSNPLHYANNLYLNGALVTTLTIPDGVTSIGYRAFEYCSSLTAVTIGDSVTSIGERAFDCCDNLTTVTIGNGVTSIGAYAFAYCYSLTSITIPDSVTSIWEWAFYGCTSLTTVTIPDSIMSIAPSAFEGCNSALYTKYELGKYVKSGENPYAVLIEVTNKNLSSYTIHADTRIIANSVFSGCELVSSVTIPDGVTSIGAYAFYDCNNLTAVTIPDSVTSIGDEAFYNCDNLTDVYVTDLSAWYGIDFANYDSNPLYYAGNLYLNGQLVTNLVIPDGVTSIGAYAFSGCYNLTTVTIPDSVTSIGAGAFYNCDNLTAVTVPDSVTSIGNCAFYNCSSLTTVTIGNGVTSIGVGAFYNCDSLTTVTIPDSVTSIGEDAFWGCYSLTTVTIGDGVTSIGEDAFLRCNSLTGVYITDVAAWCSIDFENYASNPLCYAKNLYLNGALVTTLTIPDSVTSIGEYAFFACDSLTSITIPDSVTSIGTSAFADCTSLTSITIPDSVTSIGEWAFSGCESLTSVTFAQPDGWTAGETPLSSTDLSDPATAAEYLTGTYRHYAWLRTQTD